MDSCFNEVLATIQFNEDVPIKDVQYSLASLISNSMTNDEILKKLHQQNCFKPYVFCAPYPLEPERLYHKGRMYCFNLRTPDLKFALAMKKYLPRAKGVAKVIAVELKNYKQSYINELISLTPIVCTVENRCWLPGDGLGLLDERLHINAVKKYKLQDPSFTETEEFFFEHIELTNNKHISLRYKDTVLLGHKIRVSVKPHEWAQQLAFTVLGRGFLEKNAQGFGYCIAGR
jgi:CRISPR-associated endoribonuclease Cas6